MLLKELFDTQVKYKSRKSNFDMDSLKKKRDTLLSRKNVSSKVGAFGRVRASRDSHLIHKTPHVPAQDIQDTDSYSIFIKNIVKDRLAQKNPYFPRVYNVEIVTDPSGYQRYRVDMEKLNPIDSASDEELVYLFKKMFNIDWLPERYRNIEHLDRERKIRAFNFALKEGFQNVGYLKDEALKNAFEYLKMMYTQEFGMVLDLHAGNYMFRRTPMGAQVVIVDPFS